MVELTPRAPLPADARHGFPGLELRLGEPCRKLRLQLRLDQPPPRGIPDLPSVPNTTAGDDPLVLWLAPAEWLLVSNSRTWQSFDRSSIELCALTDLSHGLTRLLVQGERTRELLSKGCGLDMHRRSFAPGQCRRTRFAGITLLLHCAAIMRFDLYVERSLARFLWRWLCDAAIEFDAGPG